MARQAARLCPLPPGWYQSVLAGLLLRTGNFQEALEVSQKALIREQEYSTLHYMVALSYCALGKFEEARAAAEGFYRVNPHVSGLQETAKRFPFKDRSAADYWVAQLQKAGIA